MASMSDSSSSEKLPVGGTFRRALLGPGLALSAELALQRRSKAIDVRQQAELFAPRVHAMQVPDNPLAWVHMSPLAAASLLLGAGMDAVPLLSCRDRNRIALLSDLLGLRALGVESLMLGRGRRLPREHALHASTVFDLSGQELIALAHELSEEEDTPNYFIGTGAQVHRAGERWAAESLVARSEAGAQFMQTQVCYDLALLEHWLQRLVSAKLTWRYAVVVSLTPFPDLKTAEWMRREMGDSLIPETVLERLADADDQEAEGVALCAETLQAMAAMPGISGVHFPSTGRPDLIAAAIDAAGLGVTSPPS